jgi:hypothetical protein
VKNLYISKESIARGFFDGAVARILELQRGDGSIPWYDGGVVDPWNHTHAAMSLTVLGRHEEARAAFTFLRETQLADGSWWAQYGAAVPMDEHKYTGDGEQEKKLRDTNFCAYPAVGVWHHYLVTQDRAFLAACWPVIRDAIGFVLAHQSDHGDIRWAADDPGTPEDDALITGCSSIYKSLECAILIARAMGEDATARDWEIARSRLGQALRHKPWRFDRQWDPKDNFSMDWYYPVLGGALTGEAARARLARRWETFVAPGKGVRCVTGQPWVTIAESCELVLALIGTGQIGKAWDIYSWQHQWRDDDGAYWMGYQYDEDVPWPQEKPAWTAAAVILAADAFLHMTPASRVLTEIAVPEMPLEASQKA